MARESGAPPPLAMLFTVLFIQVVRQSLSNSSQGVTRSTSAGAPRNLLSCQQVRACGD